ASMTIAHFSQYFAGCLLVIGHAPAFAWRDRAGPATSSASASALTTPTTFRIVISFVLSRHYSLVPNDARPGLYSASRAPPPPAKPRILRHPGRSGCRNT